MAQGIEGEEDAEDDVGGVTHAEEGDAGDRPADEEAEFAELAKGGDEEEDADGEAAEADDEGEDHHGEPWGLAFAQGGGGGVP